MKTSLVVLGVVISEVALAQDAYSCKLLSEDKYARVWQCAPTPSSANVARPLESNSASSDSTKR